MDAVAHVTTAISWSYPCRNHWRNYTHTTAPQKLAACASLRCVIEVSLPPLIIFNWRCEGDVITINRKAQSSPQRSETCFQWVVIIFSRKNLKETMLWFMAILTNQHGFRTVFCGISSDNMPSVSHFFPINLRLLSGKPVAKTPPAISLEEKRQTWRYNGIQWTYGIHAEKHLGFNIIFSQKRWDGMGSWGYFTCFRLSSEQWTVMVVSVP